MVLWITDRLPTVEDCCCCCCFPSLRTGSAIIGWIKVIFSGLALFFSIIAVLILLGLTKKTKEEDIPEQFDPFKFLEITALEISAFLFASIINLLIFISSIILLVGVCKERALFVRVGVLTYVTIYLAYSMMTFFVICTLLIYSGSHAISSVVMALFNWAFYSAIEIYMIIVTNSYYQSLVKLEQALDMVSAPNSNRNMNNS